MLKHLHQPAVRFSWLCTVLAVAAACQPSSPTNTSIKPTGTRSTLGKVNPTDPPLDSTTPHPKESGTATATPTGATPTPGASGAVTPTPTGATPTPAASGTATPTPTPTTTATPTPTPTPTATPTPAALTTTTLVLKDGSGTTVVMNDPSGMAADASGNLYIAMGGLNQIHTFTANGTDTVYAGTLQPGHADNGNRLSASFNHPSDLAFDKAGNMYVADSGNSLIRKLDNVGGVTTFAGGKTNEDGTFDGFADGAADGGVSQFTGPQGLAIDNSDANSPILYVADSGNNVIRKIAKTGGVMTVSTVAGDAAARHAGDHVGNAGEALTAAQFNGPSGLLLDASKQKLYIGDSGNNRVCTLDLATHTVTVLAGSTHGFKDDVGAAAQFSTGGRMGLAFAANGDILVADNFNNRIRRIAMGGSTHPVTTVAGKDAPGTADGTPDQAQFSTPSNLLLLNGVLYVADASNKLIRTLK